jgi:hypothetical protein
LHTLRYHEDTPPIPLWHCHSIHVLPGRVSDFASGRSCCGYSPPSSPRHQPGPLCFNFVSVCEFAQPTTQWRRSWTHPQWARATSRPLRRHQPPARAPSRVCPSRAVSLPAEVSGLAPRPGRAIPRPPSLRVHTLPVLNGEGLCARLRKRSLEVNLDLKFCGFRRSLMRMDGSALLGFLGDCWELSICGF